MKYQIVWLVLYFGAWNPLCFSSLLQPMEKMLSNSMNCSCGKIHDFEAGRKGIFPWTVTLVRKYDMENRPVCWASLINDQYAISAASCTSRYDSTMLEALIGTPNMLHSTRTSLSTVKSHPKFKYNRATKSYDSDLSLIKFRFPLNLNIMSSEINPVCLPENQKSHWYRFSHLCKRHMCKGSLKKMIMNKWEKQCAKSDLKLGRTLILNQYMGHKLHRAYGSKYLPAYEFAAMSLSIANPKKCQAAYKIKKKVHKKICGVYDKGKKSDMGCQSHAGSPVIYLKKMKSECDPDFETETGRKVRSVLLGVSSRAKNCKIKTESNKNGTVDDFFLFSRVYSHMTWIKKNTADASYCFNSK